MTPCEVVWWYHSRSVTKNLTPYRFNSAGWGPYGQNAEIHSFPTMYIMVGVNEVEMGQNNDFLPKNGLKIAFLSITILDHPTSDWAGTQNFKGIANFNMCFEKCGTSASKWAMGKSSNFNIVRLAATSIFFAEYHQKMEKTAFFCFSANYLRFWYGNTYPGYHHVKAHVQSFPKMW